MSRSPVSPKAASRSGARLPTASSTLSASRSLTTGAPSSGPSEPSRRRIGGTPTFRWMSLAPSSTARLSSTLSSMAGQPVHRHVRALSLGGSRQAFDELHRRPPRAPGFSRVRYLPEHQLLQDAPGDGYPHDREDRARKPVERLLRTPA